MVPGSEPLDPNTFAGASESVLEGFSSRLRFQSVESEFEPEPPSVHSGSEASSADVSESDLDALSDFAPVRKGLSGKQTRRAPVRRSLRTQPKDLRVPTLEEVEAEEVADGSSDWAKTPSLPDNDVAGDFGSLPVEGGLSPAFESDGGSEWVDASSASGDSFSDVPKRDVSPLGRLPVLRKRSASDAAVDEAAPKRLHLQLVAYSDSD